MDQQEQNGLEQTNREDNRQEQQETIRLKSRLWELALLFTRLGFTAFGGPAAHIAMYRQEVVERRKWLDDEYFLDLMGATNLIPGPNSTELVMHLGYLRAKVPGLLVAGTSFILPAMTLVTALAWAYKKFGATPQADALLYGVKPAIIAIIVQALVELGRKALKNPQTAAAAMGVVALYFLDVNELILLAAGGVPLVRQIKRLYPDMAVALVSSQKSFEVAVEAVGAGAVDYLFKPVCQDGLLNLVERSYNQHCHQEHIKQIIPRWSLILMRCVNFTALNRQPCTKGIRLFLLTV